jgi:hypothetical protein
MQALAAYFRSFPLSIDMYHHHRSPPQPQPPHHQLSSSDNMILCCSLTLTQFSLASQFGWLPFISAAFRDWITTGVSFI